MGGRKNSRTINWSAYLHLLGKVSDRRLSVITGIKVATVKKARRRLGVPPAPSLRVDWSSVPLGAEPDKSIAVRLGVPIRNVKAARLKKRIPPAMRPCRQCGAMFHPSGAYEFCELHRMTQKQRAIILRPQRRDYHRQKSREYRLRNIDAVKASQAAWRLRNPAYREQWRRRNPGRVAIYNSRRPNRAYYLQNRDKILQSVQSRYKSIRSQEREYSTLQSLQQIKEKLNGE